jgi:hypothetical protein
MQHRYLISETCIILSNRATYHHEGTTTTTTTTTNGSNSLTVYKNYVVCDDFKPLLYKQNETV